MVVAREVKLLGSNIEDPLDELVFLGRGPCLSDRLR